ncbi:hypothetical protein MHK_004002 [Candidatus Magnetomorum sp. HK-1]|nr:hypothetical protein MHK_004002 [Candidatus Magnetomorum sp. HK-1]
MPTQNIVPPSNITQAQAPDIQDVVSNVTQNQIDKREKNIDDQVQQFTEEINEESKVLPSFPGAPPLH